jgi:hypothetical protein
MMVAMMMMMMMRIIVIIIAAEVAVPPSLLVKIARIIFLHWAAVVVQSSRQIMTSLDLLRQMRLVLHKQKKLRRRSL